MKNIVWLGFAFFLSLLCALPADGDVVVAKPGQRVRLLCGLQGSLEWYHQEKMVVRIDGRTGMTQKGKLDISSRAIVRQKILEIPSVKETDAGMFSCKVNWNSEQHLLILVTVSASPSNDLQLGSDATLQCRVKGLDPEPAVQWRKPDGSQHPESQVAHLKPVARSDAGAWNCTFAYDGKTYSERLDVGVKEPAPAPVTPREKSNDPNCKNCVVITSPTSSPLPLLQRLDWWIWAVVGAGCLVVVVLLVLVINLWKRVQRKKRKLRRMENSRQQLMAKQYCQCSSPTAAPKLQQRRLREKPSRPPPQPLPVQ